LGFYFAEAGDDVAVIARAGARAEFETFAGGAFEGELVEFDAGSFGDEGAFEFFFGEEIVRDERRAGAAVAFVIFLRGFEERFGGFAESLRLVEKDDGTQGGFGEFEDGGSGGFCGCADPCAGFPVFGLFAAGGGHGPFGEREDGGFVYGGDGTLGAWLEFADGFDGVTEEFNADGARSFGREDVDDAAADGELAGEFDGFRAGVADGGEMVDELVVGEFGVFGENLREGEVDVGILIAPERGGDRRDDERGFAVAESIECGGAAFENVCVRGLGIPGETVEGGKDGYAAGGAGKNLGEEAEGFGELFGAAIGFGDEESGAAKFVGEVGGEERFGDVVKAGERDEVGILT